MSKKVFKIGDRVRALVDVGNKEGTKGVEGMIKEIEERIYSNGVLFDECIDGHNDFGDGYRSWWCTDDELELLENNSIHITQDGNKTIAILKKGKKEIGRGVATCSPTDTYNFNIGSWLALERLLGKSELSSVGNNATEQDMVPPFMFKVTKIEGTSGAFTEGKTYKVDEKGYVQHDFGQGTAPIEKFSDLGKMFYYNCKFELVTDSATQVREVKRVAKKGEYIKITKIGNHGPKLHVGDIHKVISESSIDIETDRGNVFATEEANEYVVLKNYVPQEEQPIINEEFKEPVNEVADELSFKKVKRQAKVGEYVLVVDAHTVPGNDYKNGDIIKCIEIESERSIRYAKGSIDIIKRVINDSEYVVLEGYQAPKTFEEEIEVPKEKLFTAEEVKELVAKTLEKSC